MAEKLPLIARFIFPVLLVAAPPMARAADPAFCRQYARGALVQVHNGFASSRCGASLQGGRWSTEFSVDFEWCLEASREAIAAERDARSKTLIGCVEK